MWFVRAVFGLTVVVLLRVLPLHASDLGHDEYVASIERWHAERDAGLRQPDGWLSFIGSGTVEPGEHTVGSGADRQVVLPSGPQRLGVLQVGTDGQVQLSADEHADALIDGQPFQQARLLTQRDEGGPTRVYLGQAWFYVVQLADGSIGWRLRDPTSPSLVNFKGLQHFPIDEAWRVAAQWRPFDTPETLELVTSAGTPDTGEVPGVAVFEVAGVSYALRPIAQDDGRLFFVFADRTSGRETYGAARFLYADAPEAGRVILDFNTAYNPPCALTPHVVCPLAPPENRLTLAVTAGEKKPAK